MRKPYFDIIVGEFSKGGRTTKGIYNGEPIFKPSDKRSTTQMYEDLHKTTDSLTEEILELSHSYASYKEKAFNKQIWCLAIGLLLGGAIQLLLEHLINLIK